MKRKKKSAQE